MSGLWPKPLRAMLPLPLFVSLALALAPARATAATQWPDANIEAIRSILQSPEAELDLAKVKLTIDQMIDPSVDVAGTLKKLDAMAGDVRARVPPGASSRVTLEALRAYLHQAGPWNGNQPFRYDLDDPLGRNIRNKLISTYLETKKGNCVSMPLLFILLGQKLGLDVTASRAPAHIFVKYRDETGTYYNLEATSGAGFTRDMWMRQQMPMTQQALDNGIYMQPLTKKETVVLMAGTLLEFYEKQRREQHSLVLATLALQYYPKYVEAMLQKSSANWQLRQRLYVSKYPTPNDIPFELRGHFMELDGQVAFWRRRAEFLGWRMPDEATEARYGARVQQAKEQAQ